MNALRCIVVSAVGICTAASCPALPAASRYEALLADPEGVRELTVLARFEESRSIDPLIFETLLTHPNHLIRLRCAEVLARIAHPNHITSLTRLTEDENTEVVEMAVFGLGLTGGTQSLDPLDRCLRTKPRPIKVRALEALGKTGAREAASLITPHLRDFHASLRGEAALALASLGDSSAAAECIGSLHDPDPYVASCALYALGRLGYEQGRQRITPFLLHEEPTVRLRAVEALGRLRSQQAVKQVETLLTGTDRMVSIKAAEALQRIGGDESAASLATLLDSPDSYLRTVALRGIATIGSGGLFEAVLPLLDDGSLMVRVAAIEAAAATGREKSRRHLLDVLRNGTGVERMTVLVRLGAIGFPDDLKILTGILTGSRDHLEREGAAAGFGNWPDRAALQKAPEIPGTAVRPFDALLAAAADTDWVVAATAIESLGKTGSREIIDDLMNAFSVRGGRVDGDGKLAVIAAIESISEREAVAVADVQDAAPFLHTAASDHDPRVRQSAVNLAQRSGISVEEKPAEDWIRGAYPWGEPSLPLGEKRILIATSRGNIEIVLFGDDAPNIVRSIIELAESGFYDSLTFHRVVPGFVIQGGCPRGDGWADAGYFLRSQFNLHRYGRGTVGMAHAGTDTPGSQFFITQTPQPHLDGRYTVVGTVVEGIEVVDRIEIGDSFTVSVIE